MKISEQKDSVAAYKHLLPSFCPLGKKALPQSVISSFSETLTLGTVHMDAIYGFLGTHQCVLEGKGMTSSLDSALQGLLHQQQISLGDPFSMTGLFYGSMPFFG